MMKRIIVAGIFSTLLTISCETEEVDNRDVPEAAVVEEDNSSDQEGIDINGEFELTINLRAKSNIISWEGLKVNLLIC